MNFLKSLFSRPSAPSRSIFYSVAVKCNRCGEVVEGNVNLNNDLSADYSSGAAVYYVRKVLMGNGQCFQRIEVELKFDPSRRLLERHCDGGSFISESGE